MKVPALWPSTFAYPADDCGGHSDCGAIKRRNNFVDEPMGIRNELSIVKNSLEEAQRKSGLIFDDEPGLKFTKLAEVNVDMRIDYLLANYAVADLVEKMSFAGWGNGGSA